MMAHGALARSRDHANCATTRRAARSVVPAPPGHPRMLQWHPHASAKARAGQPDVNSQRAFVVVAVGFTALLAGAALLAGPAGGGRAGAQAQAHRPKNQGVLRPDLTGPPGTESRQTFWK